MFVFVSGKEKGDSVLCYLFRRDRLGPSHGRKSTISGHGFNMLCDLLILPLTVLVISV